MEKSKNEEQKNLLCPIKYLIEVLGGRWKLPILCILEAGGAVRFGITIIAGLGKRRNYNKTSI